MLFIKLETTTPPNSHLTYNFQNIEVLYQYIRYYIRFLFELVLLEQQ